MFILGYHFPAEMGNVIADEKVLEKLDADVPNLDDVKEIKLYMGLRKDETEIIYTKKDTFLAKALVGFYRTMKQETGDNKKYLIYTNRYQMAELSKRIDSDDETMDLCKKFDSMEQFRVEVA